MADILSIGEMLIDFTQTEGKDGEVYYKKNAGGAPANVVCMAARLGASAGFIGKIGNDMFGKYLKQVLSDLNVETRGLILDDMYSTALAFVGKDIFGDRDYVFYRKNTADLNLSFKEVNLKLIDACRIFHFGGLSLTGEPVKTATLNSVEYAKGKGKIISYDPNWRPLLWTSKENAVQAMQNALQYVDIIKVSESELQIITDCGNLAPAIAKLLHLGVKIICVTQGAKGCIIATKDSIDLYPAYRVETVDTLGSGDSFLGAFLFKLLEKSKDITELTPAEIRDMAFFANACGAIASTRTGAIPAMPTISEVKKFIKEHENEEIV